MMTIAGASDRSRCGMAAFTVRTLCSRSISNSCRQASSVSPMSSALTLGTTMSMPPSAWAASATQASSAALSATCTALPGAVPRFARSPPTVASTSPALRAQIETWAPSSANRSAQRRPMPLLPPVTMARLPLRPRSMVFSRLARSAEVALQHRGAQRVIRVDHVAQPHPAGLGQEEVGLQLVPAVICDQPADQLAVGDPGRVLHRPRAADRHDQALVLQPGPGDAPALDHVDLERDGGRHLDRDP